MNQGSAEWFAIRCGKATGSRIADVVAQTKSGYSASRLNYESELIVERLTGQPSESYTSPAMQCGTDTEAQARASYEFQYDAIVEQVAFVPHPTISESGCSPDGMIGEDGLIEIKCPNSATHIKTLLTGKFDGKYLTQMQWQMACTGRQWCDFVSFDPRLPMEMRIFVARINRDDARISQLETEVSKFLEGVAEKVENLRRLYPAYGEAA